MALSTREQELVLWGRNNGKDTSEILRALSKLRSEEQQPQGREGVTGFALGAGKEVLSDVQSLGRAVAAPLPGPASELGISDEALEPQSEAERAGAKSVFVGGLLAGGAGFAKAGIKKLIRGGSDMFADKRVVEKLQPKMTAQETRRAIDEGRVRQGRSNPLTGKAKDVVIPEEKVRRASNVVVKDIPDAGRLNSFELADQMKKLIGKKADELKPQMQQVSFTDEGREYITREWDELKALQQNSDIWDDAASSNLKFQDKFQKFVDEAIEADNLDDLWDIRKRYDASITNSVKKANPNSAVSTQLKNEMWLQNRSVLNDIIEDSAQGLGGTAKNSFDDMSSLYTGRNNIITRERIDLKGTEGLLNPRSAIKYLITGGLGTVFGAQVL